MRESLRKRFLVVKQLIKNSPHPPTPPVAALLSAAFFQGKGWKNGSVPHHSPIPLA